MYKFEKNKTYKNGILVINDEVETIRSKARALRWTEYNPDIFNRTYTTYHQLKLAYIRGYRKDIPPASMIRTE